jgi:type I restriction enzyme M protein
MPNDLYDIEVAPSFLNKKEIMEGYQIRIDHFATRKEEFQKELKAAEAKKAAKVSKNIDKVIEQLEGKIEASRINYEKLTLEKLEVDNIIETYYAKSGKIYAIKNEYFDRTDTTLLAHFTSGLMQTERSEDVLLRVNTKIKILDTIRKDVVWQ